MKASILTIMLLLFFSNVVAQDTLIVNTANQDSIETANQIKALNLYKSIAQSKDTLSLYSNLLDEVSKKILDYTVATFKNKNSDRIVSLQNESIELLQKKKDFQFQSDSLLNLFNTKYPLYSKLIQIDDSLKSCRNVNSVNYRFKTKLKILGSALVVTGITGIVYTIVDVNNKKDIYYFGQEISKWEKMHTGMVVLSGGIVLSGIITFFF